MSCDLCPDGPTCVACGRGLEDAPLAPEPGPGPDASLEGRRFHRHARNCPWCLKVLEAEPGTDAASPDGLCSEGKRLFVAAVQSYRKGAPAP